MGLINLLFDGCVVVLLVRALVPNEGHMAFNRPYQWMIGLLEPLRARLKLPDRRLSEWCILAMLILIGIRGLLWTVFGTNLDLSVTTIPADRRSYFQYQFLSLLGAIVFLLRLYTFITLAIALGKLDNRTDHYSRLMRALLGPLKTVASWWRCLLVTLALTLFCALALWVLPWVDLHPSHARGIEGCVLRSVPLALALMVDLVPLWIVLLLIRCLHSLVPIWRPPVLDVIERVTEPALKPFQRFPLKAGRFDLTPVVPILALAVLHSLLLTLTYGTYFPVLKWLYEWL